MEKIFWIKFSMASWSFFLLFGEAMLVIDGIRPWWRMLLFAGCLLFLGEGCYKFGKHKALQEYAQNDLKKKLLFE